MIVIDTPVWIDNFAKPDSRLADLVDDVAVLVHPYVIGEVALGNLRDRDATITYLSAFFAPVKATDHEVLQVIKRHNLGGSGIGWVDAHLLTSTLITIDAKLWTRDKRLARAAEQLGVGYL